MVSFPHVAEQYLFPCLHLNVVPAESMVELRFQRCQRRVERFGASFVCWESARGPRWPVVLAREAAGTLQDPYRLATCTALGLGPGIGCSHKWHAGSGRQGLLERALFL